MPKGKGIYDEEHGAEEHVEKKRDPSETDARDEDGEGDPATRDKTPDVDEIGEEPTG